MISNNVKILLVGKKSLISRNYKKFSKFKRNIDVVSYKHFHKIKLKKYSHIFNQSPVAVPPKASVSSLVGCRFKPCLVQIFFHSSFDFSKT